ncbi:hypothetical protein SCAR479_03331 [Seiridium cardinale]|uniref:Uncharacterized protein n=1 Tax=Seiridium cardinale TaxID=138064 RepID=A0ABR2Y1G8_9PEZI
MTAQTSKRQ